MTTTTLDAALKGDTIYTTQYKESLQEADSCINHWDHYRSKSNSLFSSVDEAKTFIENNSFLTSRTDKTTLTVFSITLTNITSKPKFYCYNTKYANIYDALTFIYKESNKTDSPLHGVFPSNVTHGSDYYAALKRCEPDTFDQKIYFTHPEDLFSQYLKNNEAAFTLESVSCDTLAMKSLKKEIQKTPVAQWFQPSS